MNLAVLWLLAKCFPHKSWGGGGGGGETSFVVGVVCNKGISFIPSWFSHNIEEGGQV